MKLRVENPNLSSEYVKMLEKLGHPLPWNHNNEAGVIIDANGEAVLIVDVHQERSDQDVHDVIMAILLAVNTCGGFKITRE